VQRVGKSVHPCAFAGRSKEGIGHLRTQAERQQKVKLALKLVTATSAAVALFAIAPHAGAQSGTPNTGLPTVILTIGNAKLTAEVAATPDQRATGLMHRFSLQPDHGMLFVFESPQPLAFWMRNTHIALSIAYIDVDGRILNIEDMSPHDERTHWSRGPALYALEMKRGWFVQKGILAGAIVKGLPPLPR
jgi:hypothetical protein